MMVQNPKISIIIRNLYNSSSNRGSARIISISDNSHRNYSDYIKRSSFC